MAKFVTANLSNNAEPSILRYTTSDNKMLNIDADSFDAEIILHTFSNGSGQVIFNKPIMIIKSFAFSSCGSMTSVTIPNSVTKIGDNAFNSCNSLTSVTIPNSVTEIGDRPFYNCNSLTAFYGKFASDDNRCLIVDGVLNSFAPSGLTEYTIPNSVSEVGNGAFLRCWSLTSVTIPNSVTKIGDFAFSRCSSLTSVTIPYSVTEIKCEAFSDCGSLTNVTIPNSVTKIGNSVFSHCSSLTSVTIPNSVTKIGDDAFYDCYSLTSVTIPNSVTEIGDNAFYDCNRLHTIICKPTNPPILGNEVFRGIPSYATIIIPEGCEKAYMSSDWRRVI